MALPQYTVELTDVEIDDEFWSPWLARNRDVTLEHQYEQLEAVGTLENFERAANGKSGGFDGMWFQDSDAYKWLEAASFALATRHDADLKERIDEVIDLVAAAQEPDGYLDTYFQLVEPEYRWTNLHVMHELYCAGHLIEAAVAHHAATGEESLLDVAIALADHIDDVFGDEIDGVPGHEEIELALVKLYRVTGEERYLDRAQYFVDLRGGEDRLEWELDNLDEIGGRAYDDEVDAWERSLTDVSRAHFTDGGVYDGSYAQAHAPLREQETVEGHSVRAMYLFAAATEVVAETGDDELFSALERLWENMTTKRMYVTGGIGSEHEHEGFTGDYDLPNESAYAETCAAIGSVFWNQRMFELTGDPAYVDLVEWTLYNGFLAGVGMNGERFFYVNPLESSGDHHRKGWFTCACCPPNAARLFASLGQYCYAKRDEEFYVTQYVGSTVETSVGGVDLTLTQSSELPWGGSITIDVTTDGPVPLNLRIPDWCAEVTITVDGQPVDHDGEGFTTLERDWDGTRIELDLGIDTDLVVAHPAVEDDAGRIAVVRGPLVYCTEAVDNDRQLHQYAVPTDTDVREVHRPDLLEGVTTLTIDATVPSLDAWDGDLYLPREETGSERTDLDLVPYYAWDNRDPGEMQVWTQTGNGG